MSSPVAGGCVLLVLGGAALAVVFAVSPAVGILTVWSVGGVWLWWGAARRVSDSSATPPTPRPGDVYAGHGGEIERIQEGPGEGMSIIYPVRGEVNGS